jgi:DNA topoisomerase II
MIHYLTMATKKKNAKSLTSEETLLSQQYQSMTALEHILKKPDTYIGAIEKDEMKGWFLDEDGIFKYRTITWTPGLYKCFDEAIVNARDHFIRMSLLKKKKKHQVKNIDISCKDDIVEIMNDGNGIDIAQHPKDKLWIPEMIFMHLRTSTNYDDEEKKLVGGKNGFGIKLVFIFAEWGEIETVDHIRKLKYTQRVEKNLTIIHPPKITKFSGKPYTKVRWLPDYKKFGMKSMTSDMFSLLKKRAFDVAAVTNKSLKVTINSKPIDIKSFEQYVNLYIGDEEKMPRVSQHADRWDCIVCVSPLDEFTQVSFVNGISTGKGGKHVDYIVNQITKKMIDYIKRKKKVTVKAVTIKEQLMIFANCMIENPAFDSQTKDYMNTPISKFGSKFEITDKFIDKLAKMGVMDSAISLNEVKENKAARKTDGRKSRIIKGIPKLIDANLAGGTRSSECILILTEGDSAKSGVVSGLSKEDRNVIGVFPLKGKLLNTLNIGQEKINNNAEITNIKKIMGLRTGKSYKNKTEALKDLRYGQICFLTDQDLDGTHIKGLCMNLFSSQWADLFQMEDFLGYMNTPILKAMKGKKEVSFYNENDYEKWKTKHNGGKGWKVKYYKGLGTSSSKEFKEYFKNKKIITFKHTGEGSKDAIDKAFNKHRADDRKDWLANYDKTRRLATDKETITIENFIDDDLIHFSKYDCERSIPNLMDGSKTSIRKILFSAFKRRLVKEIKVAQLAGYVSEHSCYHHGEKSLTGAIVGTAQEFTGSNNINYLLPNGQFGTRLEGGSDAASERYIFTALNPITRYIYPESDDKILNYLDDDGTEVEPDFYMPIIPMILVNGGKGIGTGFSYEGLCYNVNSIITYLKNKLLNKPLIEIEPFYDGFKGEVIKFNDKKNIKYNKYIFKGNYKVRSSDTIQVTELPIGLWTTNFKEILDKLMDDKNSNGKKKLPIIKHFKDDCTDALVDFTIKFTPGILSKLVSKKVDSNLNLLEKTLKLYTTKSTSNMYLFDAEQKLRKYDTIYDIIDSYYPVRYIGYQKRKAYILHELSRKIRLSSNKARFIQENCDETIILRKKKKVEVIALLKERKYDIIDGDDEYKYLRSMTIDNLEEENMLKLLEECKLLKQQYININKKTIEMMWLEDLTSLEKQYEKYKKERIDRLYGGGKNSKKKKSKK